MSEKTYDLLVIGSGPGGQSAAMNAAKLGKRVGIIERKPCLGGVSLQTGTIPSKALREAAFLASRFSAGGMREDSARHTMGQNFLAEAISKKDRIVKQKEVTLLKQLLQRGVSIIPGEGSFHDPHTLAVKNPAGQTDLLQAEKIILATGSRPRRPQHIPFDKERVLDSTSILKLKQLPSSLLVVGGGVIACEFATIFAPLGVDVTIIDSHQQLLAYLDKDIADNLAGHMQEMGIQQYMNTKVNAVQRQHDKVKVETDTGQQFSVDTVLYAQGRQPNYDDLHIERAGLINDDNGWIRINEAHQTSAQHIYIIGDLAGNPALASTAMQQGVMVTQHAFAQKKQASVAPLPMAIYTIPELSYVGETEKQLQQRQVDYVTGTASYADSARGQIIGEHHGMLKLLVDRSSHQILGVHIIGEAASELIHIAQLAMACSCTVNRLADNIFNYPTLAECYKIAAMSCTDQI
jgi:NAD(P) transhydrogenase